LGLLYEQGLGGAADSEQAMELYYAVAFDNTDARQRLLKLYEADLDLPGELDKAIAWYRAAAEQGNRRA
jgi:TPR repeat protein